MLLVKVKHSAPLTENYELGDGVCIPRCVIYSNYLHFAESNYMQPVNCASFGKIIRQQFPSLTTRRLGTRGQSKYHYYGLAIKESSPYFDLNYTTSGMKSSIPSIKEEQNAKKCYSLPPHSLPSYHHPSTSTCFTKYKGSTILIPDFPKTSDIKLPQNANRMKVDTLLVMYRAHCENFIDAVTSRTFEQAQRYLTHFWQGIPLQMFQLLNQNFIIDIIAVCDVIVFKTITKVIIPQFLHQLTENTTNIVMKLIKELDYWIRLAMSGLPEKLCTVKLKLSHRFCQSLGRKLSISQLSQRFNSILRNKSAINQLFKDWSRLDVENKILQMLPGGNHINNSSWNKIRKWCREFGRILRHATSVEMITGWLENFVNSCVFENTEEENTDGRTDTGYR
ncbi:Transcription factor RFX4 [Nymphon striatum]|nr:Transcription factor RFX4 [Nymphon striatum]